MSDTQTEWPYDVERCTLRRAASAMCDGCAQSIPRFDSPPSPVATYPYRVGDHISGDPCTARPIWRLIDDMPKPAPSDP